MRVTQPDNAQLSNIQPETVSRTRPWSLQRSMLSAANAEQEELAVLADDEIVTVEVDLEDREKTNPSA